MVSKTVVESRDLLCNPIARVSGLSLGFPRRTDRMPTPALLQAAVLGRAEDSVGFLVVEFARTMGSFVVPSGRALVRCSLSCDAAGVRWWLAVCAKCGNLCPMSSPIAPGRCVLCEAQASTLNCRWLHTWGSCEDCVPFDVDEVLCNDRAEESRA